MLTLLPSARSESDAIPFDRRGSKRESITGSAMAAVRVDHAATVVPVTLTDVSAAGMGVRSNTRIEPGCVVEIHTDATGIPTCVGRVASARERDGQFHMGLQFQRRAAA